MKLLCFVLLLHLALASARFGRAYMRKSSLCHQWICINNKLNLPDDLPPKEHFSRTLHELLPPGSWQDVVETVVETCYNNPGRRYTNTCPGQALLHCALDQLNINCPSEFSKPHDGCAPVNSLAGFGNMFTQSRYENMETYLPLEVRPEWFLKNYFNRACCDVPLLFNSTVLSECGFTAMLAYFTHNPVLNYGQFYPSPVIPTQRVHVTTNDSTNIDGVWNENGTEKPTVSSDDHTNVYGLKIEDFVTESSYANLDPLDCCDVSDFIEPQWRNECDFKLKWDSNDNELVIEETVDTTEIPTTSERPIVHRDVMLVPHSCEKETCVFKKLDILSDSNTVNVALFKKLLDNFTSVNPGWERAKWRAFTKCLDRPLDYDGECEINRVLTCVFDVLTENCPTAIKNDPCKHANDGRVCQISSSKYKPKHRRSPCNLPELVNSTILTECGLTSLSKTEQVNLYNNTKKYKLTKIGCKDITPPTSCVLTKMGVLNKYGFMDYFKMKDRLRNLTHLDSSVLGAFRNAPLYKEHCNSPRKLLNVLDSILSTCPTSKRNQTSQCSNLHRHMRLASIHNQISRETNRHISRHFHHVHSPFHYHPHPHNRIHKKYSSKIIKKPLYNYGLLNSKYAPKVETIDLTPKVEKKPLVLLPVYMRVPYTNLVSRPHDNTLRSGSWLQNSPQTQSISPISTIIPISTISPVSTPPTSTATPISPTPVTYLRIPKTNLLIRSNNENLLHRPFWQSSGVTQRFKYSTISTTSTNIPVSTTSTNEAISTTPTNDEPVSTTSTNEPISTTSTSI